MLRCNEQRYRSVTLHAEWRCFLLPAMIFCLLFCPFWGDGKPLYAYATRCVSIFNNLTSSVSKNETKLSCKLLRPKDPRRKEAHNVARARVLPVFDSCARNFASPQELLSENHFDRRNMNYRRATLAVFLAVSGNGISSVGAFSPPSSRAAAAPTQKNMVATAPPMPGTANGSSSEAPLGWECDDEANCVQVPACDEEGCRTSLDVRIHNEWYDLSGESVLYFMGLLVLHQQQQCASF